MMERGWDTISAPDAHELLTSAIAHDMLRSGSWGDGKETVCMMSALVPGASSMEDCVSAGWPAWMTRTCVYLFDRQGPHEPYDRNCFALSVATALSEPVRYMQADENYRRSLLRYLLLHAASKVSPAVEACLTDSLDAVGDDAKTWKVLQDLKDAMSAEGFTVAHNWRALAAANHILRGRTTDVSLHFQTLADADLEGAQRIANDMRMAFVLALKEARA